MKVKVKILAICVIAFFSVPTSSFSISSLNAPVKPASLVLEDNTTIVPCGSVRGDQAVDISCTIKVRTDEMDLKITIHDIGLINCIVFHIIYFFSKVF